MTNPEVVAEQDWQIFQAICPSELMDMMKSEELTSSDFVHILTGMRALGFFHLAMFFMGRRRSEVKKREGFFSKILKNDPLELRAYEMREKGYGKKFAECFISNIKNEKLQQDFAKRVESFYHK